MYILKINGDELERDSSLDEMIKALEFYKGVYEKATFEIFDMNNKLITSYQPK